MIDDAHHLAKAGIANYCRGDNFTGLHLATPWNHQTFATTASTLIAPANPAVAPPETLDDRNPRRP
ncbi:hypothetical protein CHN51_00015 [Sphingorhabdus sp. YGSMI21]|nr:hypothetical protein CHN51_00015 [Sphingorhabdus sp. YGSMI21]